MVFASVPASGHCVQSGWNALNVTLSFHFINYTFVIITIIIIGCETIIISRAISKLSKRHPIYSKNQIEFIAKKTNTIRLFRVVFALFQRTIYKYLTKEISSDWMWRLNYNRKPKMNEQRDDLYNDFMKLCVFSVMIFIYWWQPCCCNFKRNIHRLMI